VATLSEIFTAHSSRPWYDLPIENWETIAGWAAATAATSAPISPYV
jgi:hypothetical protein